MEKYITLSIAVAEIVFILFKFENDLSKVTFDTDNVKNILNR